MVRIEEVFRRHRRTLVAAFAIVAMTVALPNSVRAEDGPPDDLADGVHALFVDTEREPVYLVANIQRDEWFGIPIVTGWMTDGERIWFWAGVLTGDQKTWIWLTAGGPAGIVVVDDEPPITWEDNRGNFGAVIIL